MSLEFKVESPDGATSVTSNDVASAFQAKGYQQALLSPDGQTLHLTDASGQTAEVNIPEFVSAKAKILQMTPVQGLVDTSMVDAGLRGSISALGNHDDLKRMYLQGQLRDKGFKDAQIVGKGDDFFFFNPETGRYHALTNKPGFDFSDAAGFVPKAAETVLGIGGSLAGGIGGAALGAGAGTTLAPGVGTLAGSALGGAAGSAAGGTLGRLAFDRAAAAIDPELAPYIFSEELQTGRVGEAAFDALTGGVGGVAGKVLPGLMNRGVASSTLAGVGGAVEKAGDIVGKGAGYLASDQALPRIGRAVAEGFVPVTGQAQIPALIAQSGELIPAGLRGINKAANWAYSRVPEGMQSTLDKLAQWSAKKGIAREAAPEWGERFAASVAGARPPVSAFQNAGIKDTLKNLTEETMFRNIAPGVGDALELASRGGRAVERFNAAMVKAPIKTTEILAKEAALAGNVAKNLGRAAAPLENQALLRQGGNWASEESRNIWDYSRRKPRQQ